MTKPADDSPDFRRRTAGIWIACAVLWWFLAGAFWMDLRGATPVWACFAIPLTKWTVDWLRRVGRPLSRTAFDVGLLFWVGSFAVWYGFGLSHRHGPALLQSAFIWTPAYVVPVAICFAMAARSVGWIGPKIPESQQEGPTGE